jgi:hypothetical protein
MSKKKSKMTWPDYYNGLSNKEKRAHRYAVTARCEVQFTSFYKWIKDPAAVKYPQRLVISQIIGRPIDELFPIS